MTLRDRRSDPHPVYADGPPCDPNCPGTWSTYHDGYAYGFECGVTFVPPDSLDAAWAEAEAALPEGWGLLEVTRRDWNVHCCQWDFLKANWRATAGDIRAASVDVGNNEIGRVEDGIGPTPAAALRALTVKLREGVR